MTFWDLCWVGVMILNIGSAMLAPGQLARGVGAIGAGIALLRLVLPLVSGRARSGPGTGAPIGATARRWVGALVLAFAVPFASPWLAPRVGFWNLDWRAQLILAWLALTGTLLLLTRGEDEDHRATAADAAFGPTLLPAIFLFWSAAFWLTVVWDLGLGTAMLSLDRSLPGGCWVDPLTNIFRTWEAHPASQHLFLGWRAPGEFESRTVYVHHAQPYLMAMYAYVKLVQASTGVPLHVATNLTPFLYLLSLGGAFGVLLIRFDVLRQATTRRGLVELFLGVGFIVTTWRFWFDLLRYNSDSVFPILGSLFVLLWACLEPPALKNPAMLVSLALAAVSPVYTPVLILAVACLRGTQGGTLGIRGEGAWLLRMAASSSVLALGVGLLPRALADWKGYRTYGSSWLFRSGLDGDTTYFTSILQALVKPCSVSCCGGREILDLVFPAFVPVAFGLTLGLAGHPTVRRRLLEGLMFLVAPYGFSLALTPQAVSIHPYLYDHLLIVPFVIVGGWCLLCPAVRARFRGAAFLLYLIMMVGLIMSNLIRLAQELARLPR